MREAKVITDWASVRTRTAGPDTGDICILIDGVAFPRSDWNDFVVVVLDWWARSLAKLLNGESEQERICFMDGPYAVDIKVTATKTWRARIVERDRGAPNWETVDGGTLVQSVIFAAEGILDRGGSDVRGSYGARDRESLARSLDALRHAAASATN